MFLFLGLILAIVAASNLPKPGINLPDKHSPDTEASKTGLDGLKMSGAGTDLKRQAKEIAQAVAKIGTAIEKGDLKKVAAVISKKTPEQIRDIVSAYKAKTGQSLAKAVHKCTENEFSRVRSEKIVVHKQHRGAMSEFRAINEERMEMGFTDYLIKKTSGDDTPELALAAAEQEADIYRDKSIQMSKTQTALRKDMKALAANLKEGKYDEVGSSLKKLAKTYEASSKLTHKLSAEQYKELLKSGNALSAEIAETIDTLDTRVKQLKAVRDGSAVAVTVGATVVTAGGAGVVAAGGMTASTGATAVATGTAVGTGMRTTQQVAEAVVDENKNVSDVLTAKNIGKNVRQSAIESVSTVAGLGTLSHVGTGTQLAKAVSYGSGGVVSEVLSEADSRAFEGQGRDIKTFVKDAAISAASGRLGGAAGEKIAKVSTGMVSEAMEGGADLVLGAAEEYTRTGKVSLEGTLQNAVTLAPMTAAGRVMANKQAELASGNSPDVKPDAPVKPAQGTVRFVDTSIEPTVKVQPEPAKAAAVAETEAVVKAADSTIEINAELAAMLSRNDAETAKVDAAPKVEIDPELANLTMEKDAAGPEAAAAQDKTPPLSPEAAAALTAKFDKQFAQIQKAIGKTNDIKKLQAYEEKLGELAAAHAKSGASDPNFTQAVEMYRIQEFDPKLQAAQADRHNVAYMKATLKQDGFLNDAISAMGWEPKGQVKVSVKKIGVQDLLSEKRATYKATLTDKATGEQRAARLTVFEFNGGTPEANQKNLVHQYGPVKGAEEVSNFELNERTVTLELTGGIKKDNGVGDELRAFNKYDAELAPAVYAAKWQDTTFADATSRQAIVVDEFREGLSLNETADTIQQSRDLTPAEKETAMSNLYKDYAKKTVMTRMALEQKASGYEMYMDSYGSTKYMRFTPDGKTGFKGFVEGFKISYELDNSSPAQTTKELLGNVPKKYHNAVIEGIIEGTGNTQKGVDFVYNASFRGDSMDSYIAQNYPTEYEAASSSSG